MPSSAPLTREYFLFCYIPGKSFRQFHSQKDLAKTYGYAILFPYSCMNKEMREEVCQLLERGPETKGLPDSIIGKWCQRCFHQECPVMKGRLPYIPGIKYLSLDSESQIEAIRAFAKNYIVYREA